MLKYNPDNWNNLKQTTAGGIYKATRSASTDLFIVYWINILSKLPDGNLDVSNLPKLGIQKENEEKNAVIEPRFLSRLILSSCYK